MALFGLASSAWPSLTLADEVASTLLLWTLPLYSLFAIRRVFRLSWPQTLLKGAALFLIYTIVFAATMVSVFTWAFWQQH